MSGNDSNTGLRAPELAAEAMLRAVAAGEATIARGARSAGVRAVQEALKALGEPITPDGAFGPKMHAAVVALQANAGLPQTGVIDAATLKALDDRRAGPRGPTLHEAMAQAVGASPNARPQGTAPASPTTPQDATYFTDRSELKGLTPGPVADPDTPPPAVDSVGDSLAAAARGALPDDRRAMLAEIQRALQGDAAGLAALDRLFKAGRLHAGALLPNLSAMARGRRDPQLILQAGVEPALLLAQVIRHVDNPLRVQQGAGHGTCGAGTMEYAMLRLDPAEFVRLVDGITREGAQVKLRSGRTIRMPANAVARDESGRVDLDRLFQSTLMNHATAMSWVFDYDNPNDNDSFWSAFMGDSRVPLGNFTSLLGDVFGQSFNTVSTVLRSGESVAAEVAAAASRGEKVPVILKFGAGYHWLLIEKIEPGAGGKPGAVLLRNPWGRDAGGTSPTRTALPEGKGRIRMQYADFAGALFGATLKA
jgi:hypothetical protein